MSKIYKIDLKNKFNEEKFHEIWNQADQILWDCEVREHELITIQLTGLAKSRIYDFIVQKYLDWRPSSSNFKTYNDLFRFIEVRSTAKNKIVLSFGFNLICD